MKRIFSLAVAAFVALLANAQKKDKCVADTLVLTTTPQMHCNNCEKKIKGNIRFVKGTKRIETSLAQQKVTIVYDPRKASYDDYVAAFAKIGYEIKRK